MLTLFTVPKAFQGHIGDIQRNAIKSWTLLRPNCEIILMGDDAGTDNAAKDLGVRQIPNVKRNEFGTPLLDDAFRLAEEAANNPLLCYINADIILASNFLEAVALVTQQTDRFIMTARRWNLDVSGRREFAAGWEDALRQDLASRGSLGKHTQIDFWVYSRGLLNGIPPLAVGRMAFEAWCLYKARAEKADVIDSTSEVVSVHQNHDYSHHPQGEKGIGTSLEAQRNRELIGGKPYFFTIRDRTHVLSPTGLKRPWDVWRLWRGLRAAQVLPISVPLPASMVIKALNACINAGRDFLVFVRRHRPGRRNPPTQAGPVGR